MIYKIIDTGDKKNPVYSTVFYRNSFVVPEKIYGSIETKAKYIWGAFAPANGRAGVLITGRKGSGKSMMAKVLCNMASKVDVPVFVVSEIEFTVKLVEFLSNLDNCVIFIDEFAKLIRYNQEYFLPLLSDGNKKRLFVLTENYANRIDNFILNRPERIRYHLEFDKLEVSVITEYCKDHKVPSEFTQELIKLAAGNPDFCFDHLQALIREARYANTWNTDFLISLLNLKALQSSESYRPLKLTSIEDRDTALTLEPMVIKDGLRIIKITDKDAIGRNQPLFTPPVSYPNNNLDDPFGFEPPMRSENNMVNNVNTNTTSEVTIDKNEDPIITKKKLLLAKINKDYEEVDKDIRVIENRYNREDMSGATNVVKVNIAPDQLVAVEDNIFIYQDVLGKYLIYFNHMSFKY